MKALRRSGPLTLVMLLAILLTACGGTTTQATTPPKVNPVANGNNAAPAANGQMDMMQGITIAPTATGDQAALIHTGMATINGNAVNVLLTNTNFAVYTYKDDTTLMATCTGDCAKDWPPVLATAGMMTASSSMALPKQLSVHQTPNGAQVFYDSQALYTYAADKQAGQAMGDGQDMKWYLVNAMMGNAATTNTGTTNTGTANTGTANTGTTNTAQGIAIAPDAAGNMAALIHTGKATVNGNPVNVLLTNNGFAIYTFKDDAALQATCTGDCAKDWPPVLAPKGMTTVSSSMTLPKQLSVHQTPNGAQVFYDNQALYTYAADTQAGQATGDGQDMKWYLANATMGNAATTNTGTGSTYTGTTNMMQQVITIKADMTGNMGALIHTGKATINGNLVNVLIAKNGFALYYFKDDTAFKSTCTGACAKDWPAVLAPNGMKTVSSSVALPKQLSIHQTANGSQVFYDGHALYTYATDTQAGQALGRGQDLKWYLVGFLL